MLFFFCNGMQLVSHILVYQDINPHFTSHASMFFIANFIQPTKEHRMPLPILYLASKASRDFSFIDIIIGFVGGGATGGALGYHVGIQQANRVVEPQVLLRPPVVEAQQVVSSSTQGINRALANQAQIQNNATTLVRDISTTQDSMTQAVAQMLEVSQASREIKERLKEYIAEIKVLIAQGLESLTQIELKISEFKTFLEANKMEVGFIDLINQLVAQNKLMAAECQVYQKMIRFFQEHPQLQHQVLMNDLSISKKR